MMKMQQNIFGGKGCDLNGVTQRVDECGDCPEGLTTQDITFGKLGGNYAGKRPEDCRRTVLGEPYEGKLHVRIDEGKVETTRSGYRHWFVKMHMADLGDGFRRQGATFLLYSRSSKGNSGYGPAANSFMAKSMSPGSFFYDRRHPGLNYA